MVKHILSPPFFILPVLRRSKAGLKPHQEMQPAPSDARPALIVSQSLSTFKVLPITWMYLYAHYVCSR